MTIQRAGRRSGVQPPDPGRENFDGAAVPRESGMETMKVDSLTLFFDAEERETARRFGICSGGSLADGAV